jgi:hypothetical protein
MKKTIGVSSILAVLSVATAAASLAGPASGAPPDAKAAFERLKSLAGTWEGTAAGTMPVKLVYELIGQGSTVKETLFPGTPHEMLTVYHLDGGNLVLTHYCAAGNQPRMKLARASAGPPYELVFDFTGGSNLDAAKDMHMHSAHIRLLDADRMESEWTSYQNGKAADVKTFAVTRRK